MVCQVVPTDWASLNNTDLLRLSWQEDFMFITVVSERSAVPKLYQDQNRFIAGFTFCILGGWAVLAYELIYLTVWITSCPLFSRREQGEFCGEEVAERNKRERGNEQLVWRGGTVPRQGRGEGGGSCERGQVQYRILPVRELKRRAEEECLAPRDACRMLTAGWKNRLFRVCLIHVPYWIGGVGGGSTK